MMSYRIELECSNKSKELESSFLIPLTRFMVTQGNEHAFSLYLMTLEIRCKVKVWKISLKWLRFGL